MPAASAYTIKAWRLATQGHSNDRWAPSPPRRAGRLRRRRHSRTYPPIALPILESVQADTALRARFAECLAERDLGPHRGVPFVAEYLATTGLARDGDEAIAVEEPVARLLVGACFVRSWQRHLAGPNQPSALPSLTDTTETLALLLSRRA
jgi:hypothetical protein